MDTVLMIAGALAGVVLGFAGAYGVGRVIRHRAAWAYWMLNVVALAIGVAMGYEGLALGYTWLFVAGVAFLGGAFSGLKYGYEQVVAPWNVAKVGAEERRKS